MIQFEKLGLATPILKALAGEGYVVPTPIQAEAIPHILAGKDLLGIAQTGTGKTAAFALPILNRLAASPQRALPHGCRTLILSPTRELASQIGESFRAYGRHLGLTTLTVFGGVGLRPQKDALSRGIDVLVATPGRLLDHLDRRNVRLDRIEIFVLDEADQMLDMGFIHDIRRIVARLPKGRQNLFFSATMPGEIGRLAGELLRDPVKVAVTPVASTVEQVEQRVLFVETARKRALLAEILAGEHMDRTLVFTRTKHGADRVVRHLAQVGLAAAAIHGNKSQSQREGALAAFKNGRTPVLVATDIAARGIDIEAVSHVINFDLPNVPESYVHRIGRTARAGASGKAISFCDGEERAYLKDIERLIRQSLPTRDHRSPNARQEQATPERPRGVEGDPRRGSRAGAARHGRPRSGGNAQPGKRKGHARNGQRSSPNAPGAIADVAFMRAPQPR